MIVPRYATPTKSSKLYTYTNQDQDLVKLAFRVGNFTYLKRFPAKIKPFAVTASMNALSKRNLLKTPRSVSVKSRDSYAWMADSFNRKEDLNRKLRAESVKKRSLISKKDFDSNGSPSREMRRKSIKNSFVSVNLSYSSANEQSERIKWIRDAKVKFGNFIAGKSNLGPKSSASAQEIITRIRETIACDWKKISFDVGINDSKCIEVRFFLKSLDNCEAMGYYMNTLINKNIDFLKYCLKKVPQKWGYRTEKYLIFVLAPGWVTLPKISVTLKNNQKINFSRKLAGISTRNSSLSIHHN